VAIAVITGQAGIASEGIAGTASATTTAGR